MDEVVDGLLFRLYGDAQFFDQVAGPVGFCGNGAYSREGQARAIRMGSGFAEHFGVLFLLVFAAAFPIVNPAGSALIFLDITRHAEHRLREELARRVAFYSFLVLTISLLVGSYV